MTNEENIQRIKNEALNKIRKLYNPNTKHNYTYYDGEGSMMEQISHDVEYIVSQLEKDIAKLKSQNKESI